MNKNIHLRISQREVNQHEVQKKQSCVLDSHQRPLTLGSTRGWKRVLRENFPSLIETSRTSGDAPELKNHEPENELSISSGPMTQARVDVQGELLLRPVKSLLGLRVVTEEAGFRIGVVRDLMFNPQTERVVALVLGVKEFFGMKSFQIVPWDEIVLIEEDTITVKNANSKVKLSDYPPTSFLKIDHDSIEDETMLSGTEVIDGEGQPLGTLADIYLDEVSGTIQGMEVSGQLVALSLQGKKMRGKKMPPVQFMSLAAPTQSSKSVTDNRPTPVASNATKLGPNIRTNNNASIKVKTTTKESFRAS